MDDSESELSELPSEDESEVEADTSSSNISNHNIRGYLYKSLQRPTIGTYAAESLYKWLRYGEIEVNPDYQRDVVWGDDKQSMLIDSLFKCYHMPQIVFARETTPNGTTKRICIDGKQRLTSIQRFMDGIIPHRQSENLSIKTWFKNPKGDEKSNRKILSRADRHNFESIQISCVEYDGLSLEQQREIFQRVQLGIVLTPAERMQALNSPIAALVRDVQRKIMALQSFKDFIDWGSKRGRDFQAIGQIVCVLELKRGTKVADPITTKVEKRLSESSEVSAKLRTDLTTAVDVLCHLVQHHGAYTAEPLIAPMEFVMHAYMCHVYAGKATMKQLCDAVARERKDMRKALGKNVKAPSQVFRYLLNWVQSQKFGPLADRDVTAALAITAAQSAGTDSMAPGPTVPAPKSKSDSSTITPKNIVGGSSTTSKAKSTSKNAAGLSSIVSGPPASSASAPPKVKPVSTKAGVSSASAVSASASSVPAKRKQPPTLYDGPAADPDPEVFPQVKSRGKRVHQAESDDESEYTPQSRRKKVGTTSKPSTVASSNKGAGAGTGATKRRPAITKPKLGNTPAPSSPQIVKPTNKPSPKNRVDFSVSAMPTSGRATSESTVIATVLTPKLTPPATAAPSAPSSIDVPPVVRPPQLRIPPASLIEVIPDSIKREHVSTSPFARPSPVSPHVVSSSSPAPNRLAPFHAAQAAVRTGQSVSQSDQLPPGSQTHSPVVLAAEHVPIQRKGNPRDPRLLHNRQSSRAVSRSDSTPKDEKDMLVELAELTDELEKNMGYNKPKEQEQQRIVAQGSQSASTKSCPGCSMQDIDGLGVPPPSSGDTTVLPITQSVLAASVPPRVARESTREHQVSSLVNRNGSVSQMSPSPCGTTSNVSNVSPVPMHSVQRVSSPPLPPSVQYVPPPVIQQMLKPLLEPVPSPHGPSLHASIPPLAPSPHIVQSTSFSTSLCRPPPTRPKVFQGLQTQTFNYCPVSEERTPPISGLATARFSSRSAYYDSRPTSSYDGRDDERDFREDCRGTKRSRSPAEPQNRQESWERHTNTYQDPKDDYPRHVRDHWNRPYGGGTIGRTQRER